MNDKGKSSSRVESSRVSSVVMELIRTRNNASFLNNGRDRPTPPARPPQSSLERPVMVLRPDSLLHACSSLSNLIDEWKWGEVLRSRLLGIVPHSQLTSIVGQLLDSQALSNIALRETRRPNVTDRPSEDNESFRIFNSMGPVDAVEGADGRKRPPFLFPLRSERSVTATNLVVHDDDDEQLNKCQRLSFSSPPLINMSLPMRDAMRTNLATNSLEADGEETFSVLRGKGGRRLSRSQRRSTENASHLGNCWSSGLVGQRRTNRSS